MLNNNIKSPTPTLMTNHTMPEKLNG